ncbi:MAG: hypothetical protein JXQ27_07810, partial [Acidobacteria bacterium]|nr:hypothetical protein [Acidobacteriota bacterium]
VAGSAGKLSEAAMPNRNIFVTEPGTVAESIHLRALRVSHAAGGEIIPTRRYLLGKKIGAISFFFAIRIFLQLNFVLIGKPSR